MTSLHVQEKSWNAETQRQNGENNASELLQNALQQFDDLIEDPSNFFGANDESVEEFKTGIEGIGELIEDLRITIEAEKYSSKLTDKEILNHVQPKTVQFYRTMFALKVPKTPESQNQLMNRLKSENESLVLQTNVLNDQVDLQTEKIKELESSLQSAKSSLMKSDERVQKELMLRTDLETEKLKLMEEISSLRIENLQKNQNKQNNDTTKQLDTELEELKKQSAEIGQKCQDLEDKNERFKLLMEKMCVVKEQAREIRQENDYHRQQAANLQMQVFGLEESMKLKEHECEILKRKLEAMTMAQSIQQPADNTKVLKLKMPEPTATSTPIGASNADGVQRSSSPSKAVNDSKSPMTTPTTSKAFIALASPQPYAREKHEIKAVSLERLHNNRLSPSKDIPSNNSSFVKRSSSQDNNLDDGRDFTHDTIDGSSGIASVDNVNTGKKIKSNSTPNLAAASVSPKLQQKPRNDNIPEDSAAEPNPFQHRKKHGLKKFFSSSLDVGREILAKLPDASTGIRMNRSKSGNIEAKTNDSDNGSFKRGGVRATAGPRIGWSRQEQPKKIPSISTGNSSQPFVSWDTAHVCDWLTQIGMGMYVANGERWITSGATLLQATNQDLEKELGVRNILHKKKLMLAMQAHGTEEEEMRVGKGGMHTEWIYRWLDDVGLPQYKCSFQEALMDGNMLHHLTMADLQRLQVTNLLHMLSLRRGIQTLRTINFDPTKLNRRPLENSDNEDVSTWTNHRVMEWLRTADLAEYAPNLRGSGVHGSLILFEPLFSADCLANLLQIPASKTLIRRHLASKFDDLLSEDSKQAKSKHAGNTLNLSTKIKIGKRSFGAFARLRGASSASHREFSSGEYVCPIEIKNSNKSMAQHRTTLETKMQLQDMKNQRLEEEDEFTDTEVNSQSDMEIAELDEQAKLEIGAFSAELKNMTSNLV